MAVVYITQEKTRRNFEGKLVSQYDFRPAMKYGTLEVLLPGGPSLLAPVPTVRALNEKLRDFSEDDYLLAVGDPVIMCAASAIAARNTGGKLKLLKWDRESNDYLQIQIDTSGKSF